MWIGVHGMRHISSLAKMEAKKVNANYQRCGSLGVCEDYKCVACLTRKGLVGYSKSCAPRLLPPCKGGIFIFSKISFLFLEHNEGGGPMKIVESRKRCHGDCGCLGFFYGESSSMCLLVPEPDTLIKVDNTSHVGYIKMS
ncbi:hypothetical protein RJ641_018431, partial [Dillenia turbinata]